ncbi:hypothetical protein BDBG_16404, partial [Blastomyces gilchristii SLH14081]
HFTSCSKNKNKNKNETGSVPVYNIIKQVFHTIERVYSADQTDKDTWVLNSEFSAHTISYKNLVLIVLQKINIILKVTDRLTALTTAIEKINISVEE